MSRLRVHIGGSFTLLFEDGTISSTSFLSAFPLSSRVFSRCVALSGRLADLRPVSRRGFSGHLDCARSCGLSRLAHQYREEQPGAHTGDNFLGMVLNSQTMTACLSPQRVWDILHMLPQFQHGKALPYVLYLRLLGKLVAALTVVPLGHSRCG